MLAAVIHMATSAHVSASASSTPSATARAWPVAAAAPRAFTPPPHVTEQGRADSVGIAALARDLAAHTAGDSARAAAVYEWVARNVVYDLEQYGTGLSAESPEMVFRTRRALCGGYVALFARLAAELGLEVATVSGHAKGFDYTHGQSSRRNNHTWLAVRLDGEWRLVDPTWGAGVVSDGRFLPAFNWSYFLVAPDELILSHFPEDAAWQFLGRQLSRREWERMPAVPRALIDAGFSAAAIRSAALRGVSDFPAVGPGAASGARVISAPIYGTLRRRESVVLDVHWPGAAEVLAVSGDAWIPLARDGDRFHGFLAVGDVGVWIIGRPADAPVNDYSTLLQYRVAADSAPPSH